MIRTSVTVSTVGLVCFVLGALYYALHPEHTWQEITGEPEAVPIRVRDDGGVVTTRIE